MVRRKRVKQPSEREVGIFDIFFLLKLTPMAEVAELHQKAVKTASSSIFFFRLRRSVVKRREDFLFEWIVLIGFK